MFKLSTESHCQVCEMVLQEYTVEELVDNLHKFNINESMDGIGLAISRPIERTCDALKCLNVHLIDI